MQAHKLFPAPRRLIQPVYPPLPRVEFQSHRAGLKPPRVRQPLLLLFRAVLKPFKKFKSFCSNECRVPLMESLQDLLPLQPPLFLLPLLKVPLHSQPPLLQPHSPLQSLFLLQPLLPQPPFLLQPHKRPQSPQAALLRQWLLHLLGFGLKRIWRQSKGEF